MLTKADYIRAHQYLWRTSDQWGDLVLRKTKSSARFDWLYLEGYFELMHRLICQLWGYHQPERDQCGLPEHDYCLGCHRPMPYSWRKE